MDGGEELVKKGYIFKWNSRSDRIEYSASEDKGGRRCGKDSLTDMVIKWKVDCGWWVSWLI